MQLTPLREMDASRCIMMWIKFQHSPQCSTIRPPTNLACSRSRLFLMKSSTVNEITLIGAVEIVYKSAPEPSTAHC